MMFALRKPACLILLLATPTTSSAQQAVWNVESSAAIEDSKGPREFRMVLQRSGGDLASKGVSAGTALFEGERNGNDVTGLAWAFAAGCPAESYEAAGAFTSDGAVFTVQGRAPVKDSSCKVSSFQDKTLIFTKPAPAAPVAPPVSAAPPPVPSAPQRSYWSHNGSTIYLVANGNSRELYYDAPVAGMVAAGAHPGTLLFKGQYVGGNYVGDAYVFSRRCGPRTYPVSGPVTNNFEKITMLGSKPVADANCSTARDVPDTLVFDLCAKTPVPGSRTPPCPQ